MKKPKRIDDILDRAASGKTERTANNESGKEFHRPFIRRLRRDATL
jgi:hypothetical protein